MNEIYLHIVARMADYMATHLLTVHQDLQSRTPPISRAIDIVENTQDPTVTEDVVNGKVLRVLRQQRCNDQRAVLQRSDPQEAAQDQVDVARVKVIDTDVY